MRFLVIMLVTLAVSGCELMEEVSPQTVVNPATLGPLSTKEQALIYGAEGAAQQGNTAAAERDYLTAVAESKGHVDAHMALAKLYRKQGAHEKAQAILERALTLQPNHAQANYLLGKYALEDNHYDAALEAFGRGRVSEPTNVHLALGEAVANDMLGQHQAAQLHYQRLLKYGQGVDMASLRTNLAMSYLLTGEATKAVELLKPEVKKPGASAVTRHNLALAYGLLGKTGDAKEVLKGDIDEETRTLALARLKEYLRERKYNAKAVPPTPVGVQQKETAPTPAKKPAKVQKLTLPEDVTSPQ